MKQFADLYLAVDATNKTNEKVAAMAAFFSEATPADAAWAVHFLIGRRPKRPVNSTKMQAWAAELAQLSPWLFSECYDAVGDLAETISAILPAEGEGGEDLPLYVWIEVHLEGLRGLDEDEQRTRLHQYWTRLGHAERFVWNKLITGAFRVGVSQELVVRALSQFSGVPAPVIAHRLMGNWDPKPEFFQQLVAREEAEQDSSRPYPFCLAHPLDSDLQKLGEVHEWLAEWKWDGIRSQLIRRSGQTAVWSRGEDLLTHRFPEIAQVCDALPDGTVLDGEILGWKDGRPLKFLDLQRRIGRKTVSKKLLQEVPVVLVAFDMLEWEGSDLRGRPLSERREILERLVTRQENPSLIASPTVQAGTWEEVELQRREARQRNVEGLMLKRLNSTYQVGRKKGAWWKWKIEPFTLDAVLMYAMRGSGKRASLYTDYTFGVWQDGALVPIAKAYSGLDDEEIRKVDQFIRRNTLEKFGPVRTVKPELVMELAFEGIQLSTRHKSGVAVRFPRIQRWRQDKHPDQADTLDQVKGLLALRESAGSEEPDAP